MRSEKLGGKRTEVEWWGGRCLKMSCGPRVFQTVWRCRGRVFTLEERTSWYGCLCLISRFLVKTGSRRPALSVSIWNLIYYIALKFGVTDVSDSRCSSCFFTPFFSGPPLCPTLTLVLRSLLWLTQWEAPADGYIWRFFFFFLCSGQPTKNWQG